MFLKKALTGEFSFFICVSLLLLIVCWMSYGDVLDHQYMLDDFPFLKSTYKEVYPDLASFFIHNKHHHYSPINYIFNIQLFERFSDNRQLLHLINLGLFYLNGVLFYLLANSVLKQKGTALLAAILLCLHPINSFTVNFITCNFVFISSMLLEICLLLHLKYTKRQEKDKYLLFISLFVFVISLLTFEGALLLPIMVLLVSYFIGTRSFQESLRSAVPYCIVAVLFLIIWMNQASHQSNLLGRYDQLDIHGGNYAATFIMMVGWYMANLLFGHDIVFIKNFSPLRDHVGMWVMALVVVTFFIGYLLVKVWKKDIKSFALVWFLAGFPLAAVACLANADMGFVWEPHWLFFPSMGFFLLLSVIIYQWKHKTLKVVWWGVVVSLLFYFGILTHSYNVLSKTEKGYCLYWLNTSPGNIIAALRLGEIYYEEGDNKKALYYLFMAAEKYTIPSISAQLLHNIGIIYTEMGQLDLAESYFQKALAVKPDYVHTYVALGHHYSKKIDHDKARTYLNKAIELEPKNEYPVLLLQKLPLK